MYEICFYLLNKLCVILSSSILWLSATICILILALIRILRLSRLTISHRLRILSLWVCTLSHSITWLLVLLLILSRHLISWILSVGIVGLLPELLPILVSRLLVWIGRLLLGESTSWFLSLFDVFLSSIFLDNYYT